MRFTDAMLKDKATFAPVYDALIDGTITKLDAATHDGKPLVMDFTTEIELRADGHDLVGRLNRITGDGSAPPELVKELRRS
jgi:hypothetical protein